MSWITLTRPDGSLTIINTDHASQVKPDAKNPLARSTIILLTGIQEVREMFDEIAGMAAFNE